jgi:hypothetical protein
MTTVSTSKRVFKFFLSIAAGATLGLIEAEIIANTLVEVSEARPFAVMFGIAFILLGGALQWRTYHAPPEQRLKRILTVAFGLLVVARFVRVVRSLKI